MTKETETQIASDEDLTRLFAGKPTQYRKSKSLPNLLARPCVPAPRSTASSSMILDEAYRLFQRAVPGRGEGVQFTPPFNVDYGIGLTIAAARSLNKDFMVCGGGYKQRFMRMPRIGPRCTIATPNHALDAATRLAGWEHASPVTIGDNMWFWCRTLRSPGVADWPEFHYRRGFCGLRDIRQFDRSRQSAHVIREDSRARSCLRRCREGIV